MTVLLGTFLASAVLLWLSVFGYLLMLAFFARRRRTSLPGLSELPPIAVVIPTLNEEELILHKLENLRRSNYPADRMVVVVVDGGSTDRTTALVQQMIAAGNTIELQCLSGGRGQAYQVNHVLARLTQEIVVVTDADAELDASCLRELVRMLVDDRDTAVAGVMVRPATRLLEERIHWWLLNRLWWLEGEVLSSALVSGVCYAVRRSSILPLQHESRVADINLALGAAARGFRVRLCRTARATELRAPQTLRQFVGFRRRRGCGYVAELLRVWNRARTPLGWRLAHAMRLWHFLVTPALSALAVASGCLLLCTPYWRWPLAALAVFVTPAGAALLASTTLATGSRRWWKLGVAASRLVGLIWISMLAITRHPWAHPTPGDAG